MTNDISRKIEFSAVHKIPFRVNYLRYCMVWKRNVGCSSVGAYYITLPDPLQDKVGTPTVWATMVDAILSPRAHIAEAGGPVHQTNRSFISIRQNMHKILLVSNPTKLAYQWRWCHVLKEDQEVLDSQRHVPIQPKQPNSKGEKIMQPSTYLVFSYF